MDDRQDGWRHDLWAYHADSCGNLVAGMAGWLRYLEVHSWLITVNFGGMPFFIFRISLSLA